MALKLLHLFSFIFFLFLIQSPSTHAHRDLTSEQNSFHFIKHLQGSRKGNQTKGIHQLKKYLENFGYLQYTNKLDTNNDDYFDDKLEHAIKTYQQNFHLNPTGELDKTTVSTLMTPRCGVPDIINGTNSMQGRYARLEPNYNFFSGMPKWRASKRRLTYRYLRSVPDWAIAPVDRAYQSWAAVSGFTFVKVSSASASDLTIGLFFGDHGDGYPFDGPHGILAHAFAPEDGIAHLDAAERWSDGAVHGAYDITTIAAHEIGHTLELGHSDDLEALMYPSIPLGTTKGIGSDDIIGIRVLYNE